MSCDVCDARANRLRPGQYWRCPICGHERAAPEVDSEQLTNLVIQHDLLASDWENEDDRDTDCELYRHLGEVKLKLRDFLWDNRRAIMNAVASGADADKTKNADHP